MNKQLFITGIGTGIGKTITSAVFTELFKADYWKPIQSGDLDSSDAMSVQNLTSFDVTIFPERYRFKLAASPHESANAEGISMKLSDFNLPKSNRSLMVEGAGGLFVPISDEYFIIDLIKQLKLPVALVSRDYLGCINHTLLSLEALKNRNIRIDYFVFNGAFNPQTKSLISKQLPEGIKIIEISEIKNFNQTTVTTIAKDIKWKKQL